MILVARRIKTLRVRGHKLLGQRWIVVEPGVTLSEATCKCDWVGRALTVHASGSLYYQHLLLQKKNLREDHST